MNLFHVTIAAGFILGLASYGLSRRRPGAQWHLAPFLESPFWGATIAAGLHLTWCAVAPTQLVHIVDAAGAMVALQPGQKIEMDVLHRIHIAIGGLATVFLAFRPLKRICVALGDGDDVRFHRKGD